jgi:glucosylceramidase
MKTKEEESNEMKAFITDYNNNRFWQEMPEFEKGENAMRTVRVYRDCKYQTIRGFGGAFTQASGYSYNLLPEDKREEFVKAYFSEEGLAYNLGRIHINSCDFALGNYIYIKGEDDPLDNFDLSIDEKYILPLLKAAEKYGEIELFATPWSPPAYMKTNDDMNHGGRLKKEYYGKWADYIVKFVLEMKKRGANIVRMSIQNEPAAVQTWDSCIYDAEEEGIFAASFLGPKLEEAGLGDIRLFVWDHNKEMLWDRAKGSMSVKDADKYIKGFAFHWYTGDHFDAIGITHDAFPDKELFFTEGCVEYSRFADSGEVGKAEMYAHDMLGNLNAGANGIIDWNLLLDSKGGPNHVQNYCAAPVMCREDFSDFEKRLSYYYIGHFSRYIRKGAVRLATSRFTDTVEAGAFENPDGSVAVLLLNRTDSDNRFCLTDGAESKTFTLPAHSIVTVLM